MSDGVNAPKMLARLAGCVNNTCSNICLYEKKKRKKIKPSNLLLLIFVATGTDTRGKYGIFDLWTIRHATKYSRRRVRQLPQHDQESPSPLILTERNSLCRKYTARMHEGAPMRYPGGKYLAVSESAITKRGVNARSRIFARLRSRARYFEMHKSGIYTADKIYIRIVSRNETRKRPSRSREYDMSPARLFIINIGNYVLEIIAAREIRVMRG